MGVQIKSRFEQIYGGGQRKIDKDSPEIRLLEFMCTKEPEKAKELFSDSVSGEKPWVDAPQGKFCGIDEIEAFINGWHDSFNAQTCEIVPVVQTVSAGRAVCECVLHFVKDKENKHIPMAAVADLAPNGKMGAFRLYFHYKWAEGFNAYRAPIFESSNLEPADNSLFTGAVREYFEALHTLPGVDVERIINCVGERCAFGGYGLEEETLSVKTRDEIRKDYENMATYIPRWLYIRVQTIIDDGVNCVVEWQHIITREGREEGGRICESGISAYERGEDGKLCAIRICDYANCEPEIDWGTARNPENIALEINYLE